MNDHRTTCDPERIELFLEQKLSDGEQAAFESHLSSCEDCRQRLEATAATEDIWTGVRQFLRDRRLPPDDLESDSSASTDEDASSGHATVLKLLAPTDDERMLGRWGTYEVVGVIGTGGMGVVLKALDVALNRYVAIKVLAPHLGSSGAARRRFSREAQAAAAVVHDNVIEIYGVAEAAGLPYLVMPYVRGPSLQRRIDEKGPLALVEILRVGTQAAAGLAAAHAQGLVHRDVKPANILLADGIERVKLTDFGLARAADDASLTKTGVIAGTPQYMSPEQARGEAIDQRSDLFSLGSVLYAMCTGRAPFRAETSYGVLRRITDEEPRPIREINPDIPEWLCEIVAKFMAKQPEDRFQSAVEVAKLLEECLAHVQQPTVVPLPASLPKPAIRRRRRWFKTTVATLGIFLMGLFGMLLAKATDPPDISGQWQGEGWGQVTLTQIAPGEYTGTYTETVAEGKEPGKIGLKWSRIERRFNGTWREGDDSRFGELSIRRMNNGIRGALTTDAKSKINPATPRLADLVWSPGESVSAETGAPKPTGGTALAKESVAASGETAGEQAPIAQAIERLVHGVHVGIPENGTSKSLALLKGPLLRHDDRPAGVWYALGTFWAWGDGGRPAALLDLSLTGLAESRTWCFEMVALSDRPVFAETATNRWWATEGPGWNPRSLPDAPKPAADGEGRMAQMKALASRFAGYRRQWNGENLAQLTFRPEPILRYDKPLDGALFVFVHGANDPDILLVLEAERQSHGGFEWKYHCAPFSANGLVLKFDGTEVWTRPEISDLRTKSSDPYRIFIAPIDNEIKKLLPPVSDSSKAAEANREETQPAAESKKHDGRVTADETRPTSTAAGTLAAQPGVTTKPFGRVRGEPVDLYTLTNETGMKVSITNYGGIVVSVVVRDRDGKYDDVALGYDLVDDYVKDTSYFGALSGRYGNRIAKGKFSLEGKEHTLSQNNLAHHLHGGKQGFDKVIWKANVPNPSRPTLVLSYLSKDGEEGYPGNLAVTVTYGLMNSGCLCIHYEAKTDKATPVNLTNHLCFNLAGAGQGDVLGHELWIDAERFTPIDKDLIPTGELRPLQNTPFDFRTATTIGQRINQEDEQLKYGLGYDHNFVLRESTNPSRLAARVYEPKSGRCLNVYTTEPGIQFCSSNRLDGSIVGKGRKVYKDRSGFCLEAQHFPDSPNEPGFPTTILAPGKQYSTFTIYQFSTLAAAPR